MSFATPEKSKSPTAHSLWKPRSSEISAVEIPSLPIECLKTQPSQVTPDAERQNRLFSELQTQIKEHLYSARKSATLARTQAMAHEKRQSLCRNALELFERALELKTQLRSLALRMGLAERRKARSLEGAPEWREIRRAIQSSADLNQVKLSFAA